MLITFRNECLFNFLVLTYVENAFIGSGKCGGIETEEAFAEELMILGVFL